MNSACRLCGRRLLDESDVWAGRCNNDEKCQGRRASIDKVSTLICAAAHCDNGAEIACVDMSRALRQDVSAGAPLPDAETIARIVYGDDLADGWCSTAWSDETYPHVSALLEEQL